MKTQNDCNQGLDRFLLGNASVLILTYKNENEANIFPLQIYLTPITLRDPSSTYLQAFYARAERRLHQLNTRIAWRGTISLQLSFEVKSTHPYQSWPCDKRNGPCPNCS